MARPLYFPSLLLVFADAAGNRRVCCIQIKRRGRLPTSDYVPPAPRRGRHPRVASLAPAGQFTFCPHRPAPRAPQRAGPFPCGASGVPPYRVGGDVAKEDGLPRQRARWLAMTGWGGPPLLPRPRVPRRGRCPHRPVSPRSSFLRRGAHCAPAVSCRGNIRRGIPGAPKETGTPSGGWLSSGRKSPKASQEGGISISPLPDTHPP